VLIAVTLSLVAGGALFNGLHLLEKRSEELRTDTMQLAHIAELDMVRILDGAHQLLATLAKLPSANGWDDRACSVLLATVNSDFEYDHLIAVDRQGVIMCSTSGPGRIGLPAPDRDLHELVVTSGDFKVGTYGTGRVSGNEVIRVGFPVVDDAGAVIGALYAGINLTWLNTAISQWKLGEKATIDITDRNGILIARHPDPSLAGRPLASNLKPFLSVAEAGTAEVVDEDGTIRLYGYVPTESGPSDGLAVFVGRDRALAFADINRSIWINTAVVFAGLLLAAVFAFIYVRRFLTRPFENLLAVAGRWRDGDWSARAGAESGIPEFDRLASAFDGMAAAVHDRDQSLNYRDVMLDAITKSAAELVTAGTIAEAIPRILQRLGEALHADRILVLQNHSTGPPLTLRNAWQGPGATVEVRPEYFASLPADQSPEVMEWQRPLLEGKLIEVLRRDTRGEAREVFDMFGIDSNLQAPILIEGKLFGQLSIDDCKNERSWSPIEKEAVTVLADLIGAAITRESHLEKLSNADAAVRSSPAIVYRFSTETPPPRLVYVSDNVVMFGSSAAELLADPELYLARVHPDDRDLVEASWATAASGVGGTYEFRIVDDDGSYHWVENRYAPKRNASGKLVEVSGVLVDVTERKAAEEKLQFANSLLATLKETSPDAILVVDANKKISTFNQHFLDLWRLTPDLLGPGTDDDALAVAALQMKHPEAFKARASYLYDNPDASVREDVEMADGRYLEQITSPMRAADGRYMGRVWFAHDVTERRRAVEIAEATLARAQEQMRAIGTLSKMELSGDIESLARRITEEAARVVGCERTNVWQFNANETQLVRIDLYEASNGTHSAGTVVDESQYAHEFKTLKEVTHVAVDDALTDPRTAGYVENYLKPLRITSVLNAVIRVSGQNLGILCFEHVGKPHQWARDEIAFALQLADKIGIGIVNQQRRIEEEKRRAGEAELAEAQEVAHLGSWTFDPRGNAATYSKESYRILGVDPKTFDGSYEGYLSRVHPDDRVTFAHAFANSTASHSDYACEYRLLMDDGSVKWIHDIGRNSYDAKGRHVRTVGTMQDITERKQAEQQIAQMAHFDHLTGLANRRVFVEALRREISRVGRDGRNFAVLYLDLDHFKDVNDTLGHPVGDLLLQAVSGRLQEITRLTDTVARFGGDEFALIDADINEPADAAVLADKVLNAISAPFLIGVDEIRTGASIGIAVFGAESPDAEMLLSHADVALYRAKAEGRGMYRFFTEAMDSEVRTRVTLGTELRKAIVAEQLFLMYQPQVDVDTGRIVGVEALVRWRHPERGLVSPGEFIPIAERSGLIVSLGNWVMLEACRQTRKWLDAGVSPARIAINLSALQFRTPLELEANLAAVMKETGLPSNLVELELTESVLMEASGEHNDVLLRLRKAGFRLAIDDFGTGYSSLDYLRRFPVDRIKIAQSFIFGMMESSDNKVIVRAAVGLARELNLDVVVEGVETAEQLRLLRGWGCRTIQGYYYSKPRPAREITAILRNGGIIQPHVRTVAALAVASLN
jgi:diguanylate cyclase (GGDEF)-like protein/PAS domain S-box-containing protein